MDEDSIKGRFDIVSNLSRKLAKDPFFVSDIRLDEFPQDQVVHSLEMIFGFILSMYNAAKTIFSNYDTLTLDEKLIRLIYSRFVLYPKFSQRPLTTNLNDILDQDALTYAKKCYDEIINSEDQSECKWDDMPLYTKFFEICVRVLIEENIVDAKEIAEENENQSLDFFMPVESLFGTRNVLAVAFKGLFSHVKWELEEKIKYSNISSYEKAILTPKKVPGPDSQLKKYPLLYLYFDNFEEIASDWDKKYFQAAMHEGDIRSCKFSLDDIMKNENIFLELYKNGLVRIRLWDGTMLVRNEEDFYFDRATHPERYIDEISHLHDPAIIKERKILLKKIGAVVDALKLRYGLIKSDKT